ncbi:MAG: hypothetical protein PHP57_04820 [Sideroxydans sp.]|nr:hypothetical protein [Sideroxydans sp.]
MKMHSGLSYFAFITLMLVSGCTNAAVEGCVDVAFGSVHLSVPKQQRISAFGNFTFAFDTHIPGVACPMGCDELFVNASSNNATPEQVWKNLAPQFTGRMSGSYRIYVDQFDQAVSKPLEEILVPSEVARPQDEFYSCDLEDPKNNPGCEVRVVTKSGLTAYFSIRRKSLSKAREAGGFVKTTLEQFYDNHTKGICK